MGYFENILGICDRGMIFELFPIDDIHFAPIRGEVEEDYIVGIQKIDGYYTEFPICHIKDMPRLSGSASYYDVTGSFTFENETYLFQIDFSDEDRGRFENSTVLFNIEKGHRGVIATNIEIVSTSSE